MSDEKKYSGLFLSIKGGNDEASEKKTKVKALKIYINMAQKLYFKVLVLIEAAPVPFIWLQYLSFQKSTFLQVRYKCCQTCIHLNLMTSKS